MAETGDRILPRANGVVYLEKPPLLYWLSSWAIQLFGATAFAARLPSAAAALATTWLLVAAGRRLGPRGAGLLSGIVFTTCLGALIVAREVLFDSLLTLWITVALLAFWFGTDPAVEKSRRRTWLAAGYAGLALGTMTKGLVAIALPVAVIFAFTLLSRDVGRLRRAGSPAGLLLFLAIAVPWHVLAGLRQRQFAWFYFVNEHWLRFLGRRQPADFHQDPIFSPVLSLVLLALPWSVFLPAALRSELAQSRARAEGQKRIPAGTLFLLCWMVVPALFFTLSRTRTYYYQLPCVPALALLCGRLWARTASRSRASPRNAWLLIPAAVLAAALAAGWVFARLGPSGSLRNAAWHALGFACGGWLLLGLAVAIAMMAAGREAAALSVVAASALVTAAVAAHFAATSPQPVFRSEQGAARLITDLEPPEGTRVAVEGKFENHSSLAFYLPRRLRPLLVVDALGQGDLAFGSSLEDTREIFVSTPTMFELAQSHPLVYLTLSPSKLKVPPALKLLACDDEIMLWTNLRGVTPGRWPEEAGIGFKREFAAGDRLALGLLRRAPGRRRGGLRAPRGFPR